MIDEVRLLSQYDWWMHSIKSKLYHNPKSSFDFIYNIPSTSSTSSIYSTHYIAYLHLYLHSIAPTLTSSSSSSTSWYLWLTCYFRSEKLTAFIFISLNKELNLLFLYGRITRYRYMMIMLSNQLVKLLINNFYCT